jgi:hypothetical protein
VHAPVALLCSTTQRAMAAVTPTTRATRFCLEALAALPTALLTSLGKPIFFEAAKVEPDAPSLITHYLLLTTCYLLLTTYYLLLTTHYLLLTTYYSGRARRAAQTSGGSLHAWRAAGAAPPRDRRWDS